VLPAHPAFPALPRLATQGGIFQLRLTFSEHYPDKPPRVRFTNEVFHPNVYSDGTVRSQPFVEASHFRS
jgi:ubiquitin-protein ligase